MEKYFEIFIRVIEFIVPEGIILNVRGDKCG